MKLRADERKDREDGLTVCVVEEADTPKHGYDEPFVGGTPAGGQDVRTGGRQDSRLRLMDMGIS